MSLHIPCPHCARTVDLPDAYLGAGVRCPQCDVIFAVQQTGFTAVAPPDRGELNYELADTLKVKPAALPRSARYTPGRGKLLLTLGCTSIAISVLGIAANVVALGAPVLFSPPAFLLGLSAWLMGQRDMEKIRITAMDPDAEKLTHLGWVAGITGTLLAVMVLFCGLGGLYLLLAKASGPVVD